MSAYTMCRGTMHGATVMAEPHDTTGTYLGSPALAAAALIRRS